MSSITLNNIAVTAASTPAPNPGSAAARESSAAQNISVQAVQNDNTRSARREQTNAQQRTISRDSRRTEASFHKSPDGDAKTQQREDIVKPKRHDGKLDISA